jgi:hypothetical protein
MAPLSVEQTSNILNGNADDVYKTIKAVTVSNRTEVSHVVDVTYGQLFSIFDRIANDGPLVSGMLEEAYKNTIEIEGGATYSSRIFPFTVEIEKHIGEFGGAIPGPVRQKLTPAILSYIVHHFGNKRI